MRDPFDDVFFDPIDPVDTNDYITGQKTKDIFKDARFLADLKKWYAAKGESFETDDEMLRDYYDDFQWRDINTAGNVKAIQETQTLGEEDLRRMSRLQQVYNEMPLPWQDGGASDIFGAADTTGHIAKNILLDPTNVLGFGAGKMASRAVLKKTMQDQMADRVLRDSALKATAGEAALNAGINAASSVATQQRDVDLGLQDEISWNNVGIEAGAGAALGGAIGGIVSYFSAKHGVNIGEQAARRLLDSGITKENIDGMSKKELDTLISDLTSKDPNVAAPKIQAMQEKNWRSDRQQLESLLKDGGMTMEDVSSMSPDQREQFAARFNEDPEVAMQEFLQRKIGEPTPPPKTPEEIAAEAAEAEKAKFMEVGGKSIDTLKANQELFDLESHYTALADMLAETEGVGSDIYGRVVEDLAFTRSLLTMHDSIARRKEQILAIDEKDGQTAFRQAQREHAFIINMERRLFELQRKMVDGYDTPEEMDEMAEEAGNIAKELDKNTPKTAEVAPEAAPSATAPTTTKKTKKKAGTEQVVMQEEAAPSIEDQINEQLAPAGGEEVTPAASDVPTDPELAPKPKRTRKKVAVDPMDEIDTMTEAEAEAVATQITPVAVAPEKVETPKAAVPYERVTNLITSSGIEIKGEPTERKLIVAARGYAKENDLPVSEKVKGKELLAALDEADPEAVTKLAPLAKEVSDLRKQLEQEKGVPIPQEQATEIFRQLADNAGLTKEQRASVERLVTIFESPVTTTIVGSDGKPLTVTIEDGKIVDYSTPPPKGTQAILRPGKTLGATDPNSEGHVVTRDIPTPRRSEMDATDAGTTANMIEEGFIGGIDNARAYANLKGIKGPVKFRATSYIGNLADSARGLKTGDIGYYDPRSRKIYRSAGSIDRSVNPNKIHIPTAAELSDYAKNHPIKSVEEQDLEYERITRDAWDEGKALLETKNEKLKITPEEFDKDWYPGAHKDDFDFGKIKDFDEGRRDAASEAKAAKKAKKAKKAAKPEPTPVAKTAEPPTPTKAADTPTGSPTPSTRIIPATMKEAMTAFLAGDKTAIARHMMSRAAEEAAAKASALSKTPPVAKTATDVIEEAKKQPKITTKKSRSVPKEPVSDAPAAAAEPDPIAMRVPGSVGDSTNPAEGWSLAIRAIKGKEFEKAKEKGFAPLRVLSNAQKEQGKGLETLLGQSDPEDWEVGIVPSSTRTYTKKPHEFIADSDQTNARRSNKAEKDAAVEAAKGRTTEPPISAEEALDIKLTSLTPEQIQAVEYYARTFVKRKASGAFSHAKNEFADLFNVGKGNPEFAAERLLTLAKEGNLRLADLIRLNMEMHNTPFPSDVGQFNEHLSALKTLTELELSVAPSGVALPNESRIEAIAKIDALKDTFPPEEIADFKRIIDAIGSDAKPIVQYSQKHDRYVVGSSWDLDQVIKLRGRFGGSKTAGGWTDSLEARANRPRAYVLLHEIAHWGYFNMLTAAERLEFMEMIPSLYDSIVPKDKGKYAAVAKKLSDKLSPTVQSPSFDVSIGTIGPDGEEVIQTGKMRTEKTKEGRFYDHAATSPQELFAEQLAMWAARRMKGELNASSESFWRRIYSFVRQIFDRFFVGAEIDPRFIPYFQRILPDEAASKAALADLVQVDGFKPETKMGAAAQKRLMDVRYILKSIEAEGALPVHEREVDYTTAAELRIFALSVAPPKGIGIFAARHGEKLRSAPFRVLAKHTDELRAASRAIASVLGKNYDADPSAEVIDTANAFMRSNDIEDFEDVSFGDMDDDIAAQWLKANDTGADSVTDVTGLSVHDYDPREVAKIMYQGYEGKDGKKFPPLIETLTKIDEVLSQAIYDSEGVVVAGQSADKVYTHTRSRSKNFRRLDETKEEYEARKGRVKKAKEVGKAIRSAKKFEEMDADELRELSKDVRAKLAPGSDGKSPAEAEDFVEFGVTKSATSTQRALAMQIPHRDPDILFTMRQMTQRLTGMFPKLEEELLSDAGGSTFSTYRRQLRDIAKHVAKPHKKEETNMAIEKLKAMVSRYADGAKPEDIDRIVGQVLTNLTGNNKTLSKQYPSPGIAPEVLESKVTHQLTGSIVIDPSAAATLARNTIAAMPESKRERLSAFISGVGRDNAGEPVVFYHGTPNGAAFERGLNPSMRPSKPTAMYGSGIYITESPAVASGVHAKRPTPEAIDRLIEGLPEGKRDQAKQIMTMLTMNRDRLAMIAKELPSEMTRADVRDASTLNRLLKARGDLITDIGVLQHELEQLGVNYSPDVLPVVVRAERTLDLSRKMLTSDDAEMIAVMRNLVFQNELPKETSVAMFANRSGQSAYEQIIGAIASHRRVEIGVAKEIFTQSLKDVGYDSIMTSQSSRNTDGVTIEHKSLVVLDPSKVKHLEAEEFSPALTGIFEMKSTHTLDVAARSVGEKVSETEFIAAARADGIPDHVALLMEAIRKRKPSISSDNKSALLSFSPLAQISSNTDRLRKFGINWLSDIIAPKTGTGYYERVNVNMARSVMPIIQSLDHLPDAGNMAQRWARNLSPKNRVQPPSHKAILSAVRRGVKSKQFADLPRDQKDIAINIIAEFQKAHGVLRSLKLFAGRIENYFPQIWSVDAIHKDPEAFANKMARYFMREAKDRGEELAPDDALAISRRMATNLTDGEGVYVAPSWSGKETTGDHIDFQRLIRLEKYPEMMDELEGFLENDLQSVMVKYFDTFHRRVDFVKNFGHNGHGLSDYIRVADEGLPAVRAMLSSKKVRRRAFRRDDALAGDTSEDSVMTIEHTDIMPPFQTKDQADSAAKKALDIAKRQGGAAAAEYIYSLSPTPSDAWRIRANGIGHALAEFTGRDLRPSNEVRKYIEAVYATAQHKRVNPGDLFDHSGAKVSRAIRSFNSVTLLSYTVLTSLSDPVLSLVRSGNMKAWSKGMAKWMTDSDYRAGLRNIGVAVENLTHQRMQNLYGADGSQWANAFFNATLLTPWTNIQREMTGAVALEAFKSEQARALKHYKKGQPIGEQPLAFKTAYRFMKRYGVEHLLQPGQPALSTLDINDIMKNDAVAQGIIRFANETIFTPNGNDIPLWAQTPWGSVAMQLKSFPLLMGRMTRHVIEEAASGNPWPLTYMLTAGGAAGAGSIYAHDYLRSRGGKDNKSAAPKERESEELVLQAMLQFGGLGLLGGLLVDSAEQLDNGAFGAQRILSLVGGPAVGDAISVINVTAGIADSNEGSNAKERQAVREVFGRIPFLGGNVALKEGVVDSIAGKKMERGSSGGSSGGGYGGGGYGGSGYGGKGY